MSERTLSSKIIKIYAKTGIQTSFTVVIFFVLA